MTEVTVEEPGTGTFRSAWGHRRWRWLLSGFTVSMTGDFLYSVALVVYLIDRTGSVAWVSAAVVARMAPYVLLSAPAGLLADRFDRRRLMVALDVARAAVIAAMAVAAWADAPPIVLVVLAALAAAATTPYRPAAVAATPALVGEDDLAAANAAESIIAQIAWFVGPALGAAVVGFSDPGWAFLVNAATFMASAALVSRIGDAGGATATTGGPDGAGHGADVADEAANDSGSGLWAGLSEGARAVRTDRGLLALTLLVSALLFTFGMEQVLHVAVAVDRLDRGAAWVGVMGAAIGAGGLLVAPFTARMGRSPAIGTWLVASGLGTGVPMIVLALTTSPTVVFAALLVEGAATVVNEVLLITMLQRACPDHLLARVFGLTESSSALTQLLGSLLAPALVAGAGLGVALWTGGGVTVVVSLLAAPAMLALAARTESDRRRIAPLVARLRRLGVFAEAGDAAVERLARAAEPVAVTAGEVVITEGDEPEDMYVVDTGELVVRSRGETGGPQREVNRMGPDDWFGEIGLLHQIPRTATVAAETDCELIRIPGATFIDALGEPELLADPIRRTVATRLARTHPSRAAGP